MKRFLAVWSWVCLSALGLAVSAAAQQPVNCANPAGTPNDWLCMCDAKIMGLSTISKGGFEGIVQARLELLNPADGNVRYWTVCNVNEGRTDAGGNPETVAKNGAQMSAIHDSYRQTCDELNHLLTLGFALRKKVRFYFQTAYFTSCTDVPTYGGYPAGDYDDPNGRLGAWDGLYEIEVLDTEVP